MNMIDFVKNGTVHRFVKKYTIVAKLIKILFRIYFINALEILQVNKFTKQWPICANNLFA